jgi:hypothetical protein
MDLATLRVAMRAAVIIAAIYLVVGVEAVSETEGNAVA